MGAPIRVLLVEDSDDDAQLIVRELQRGGYDPIWERVDTPAAMKTVIDRHTWDLVLGDYTMPHFSGTAAMTLLRQHGVDVPFIFVSGTIGEDIAVAAMKAGAQDYVMKGNMKRLVPAVQRELGDAEVRRERRRADAALLERARLAELTSEVGLALSRAATAQDILHRCCDGFVRHLDVALAQIWIQSEETGSLVLAASAGLGAPPPAPPGGLALASPGIGTIAAELHPYLSNDAVGDPRVPEQTWVVERGITAFAGYPLAVQGRLIGVMATFGTRPITDFAFKAAGAVADALAVGIANKQAEQALRRSEATHRSLVEDSPYGIFRGAPDGTLLAVNPALVQMLGYGSTADLLAVHLDQLSAAPGAGPEVDDPGVPSTADTLWRRKDGRTLTVRLTRRGVYDSAGQLESSTVIVEDVTDRRLMETQLRQAQKMEAIGRLAGGVAHDFNNLLTAILGFADLLLQDIPPDHRAREGAMEIRDAARRAADLTRQLLDFSRQQVLSPRLVSLNDIVVGMEKMLKRLIGADIEFRTALSSAIGLAQADPGQLEQVFLNLIVNARDAMPAGGSLLIETGNVELDPAYVREHPGVEPGSYVVLTVTDTGVGMDAATQARIFEPFFTTKPNGEGTGLGLATVYGIVQQSGGHIALWSEPGRGTSFRVFLRRVDGPVAAKPAAPGHLRSSEGTETVLLVEDQPEIRRVAQRMLESRGYTVLAAADGKEALALASRPTVRIDALVTDVVMPGLGGREVAQALAAERPHLRVLFVSGRLPDTSVLGPGARFLRKPFTAEELAGALRAVLDGERV